MVVHFFLFFIISDVRNTTHFTIGLQTDMSQIIEK